MNSMAACLATCVLCTPIFSHTVMKQIEASKQGHGTHGTEWQANGYDWYQHYHLQRGHSSSALSA